MKARLTVQSDSLTAALAGLPNAVNRLVQVAALKAGAEPMRAEAARLAPRDEQAGPPHLADSILITVPTERQLEALGTETAVVAVGPSSKTFWGLFQEFGYGYGAAHPFLRPAFDTTVRESLAIIGQRLWAGIRDYRGGPPTTGGGLR